MIMNFFLMEEIFYSYVLPVGNGINEQNRLIFVKKKSHNSFENNIIEQNQNNNYINEFKDKFNPNENFKYNPMENEYKINLQFVHSKGQIYNIVISHNETFFQQ